MAAEKGNDIMSRYVVNVNSYLAKRKIKQSFISLKTGIDADKLSRILTGSKDITGSNMEKIAYALGHKVEFFLSDSFCVPDIEDRTLKEAAFCAGELNKEQEIFAMKIIDLIEHMDEVLGAKERFLMVAESE